MFLKTTSFFVFLLFFCRTSFAQADMRCYLADTDAGARSNNIDMQHMLLEVKFEPEKGKVIGEVTYDFMPLQKEVDSVFLDAPKIEIKQVNLDGKEVKFDTNDKGIIIRPAKPLTWETKHTLTIGYEATPRKGLYFIGWNDPKNLSLKQIWTQGQGIDNRYWIPSFDDMNDKLTTEVKITFDKNYKALSNGVLISEKEQKDGSKVWHYKMSHPHAPYLVMIGIGKYEIKTYKSKGGVQLDCWYYPEYPERVEPTYRYSVEMMDWMEKEFGVKYPWEKYSQIPVQDFMYGAMENTTATVFGDFYHMDERAFLDRYYIGTNAHELTHQWFGDYITAHSSEDTWLQESFATHYQKHFERSIFGEDHFQWNRRNEMNSILAASERDNNPVVHTKAGSERVYPKGSLVLDMLKYLLGKEQFNKALAHYLKEHPYQNVDTHDFYLAFLKTLGINLDWFFQQWIYHGGEPSYKVSYENLSGADGKFTRFTVNQVQKTNDLVGVFKMPVWFEVHYADGSSDRKQEWISEKVHTVDIPNEKGKAIDYVLFDPNSEIIKKVDFQKPIEMLKAQAAKAKNMIDRNDALVALSKFSFAERKDFLIESFGKEKFYANRDEIAKQLVGNISEVDPAVIKNLLKDKNAKVRWGIIQNTEKIPVELLRDFEVLLSDSSYWTVEKALIKLCDQFPENTERYLKLTENSNGIGNHILINRLEIGSQLNREKYLPQLVDLTSISYEFQTRKNAMDALKRLNYLDNTAIQNIFDAALNPNNRLAGPAKAVLKHFMIQTAYKKTITAFYKSREWEGWQREILADIF